MLFNSVAFLYFYLLVFFVYFFGPVRLRNLNLLAASCFFYMCFIPSFILFLFAIILIDYFAGIGIHRSTGRSRKKWLYASLAANLGLLFIFKYYNFAGETLMYLADVAGFQVYIPRLAVILPLGLSFHTFQAMSYTIEVYRGNVPPERSLLNYSLYVLFFPQLVAGPIERPQRLLPQFRVLHSFDVERTIRGLKEIVWGLFKKMVIADLLAPFVNQAFHSPRDCSGPVLAIATVFFSVQIYCDFSGYSLIALGTARILGFDLVKNFDSPYLARSFTEFWHRWHISLSSWFRDYVYIPLGGGKCSFLRKVRNVFIVFLLSGLWHGANWTFVVWGALHATFLTSEMLLVKLRGAANIEQRKNTVAAAIGSLFSWAIVWLGVTWGWIFFRANSVADAWYITTHLFDARSFQWEHLWGMGLPRFEMMLAVLWIALLFLVELVSRSKSEWWRRCWEIHPLRWSVYAAAVYGIVFFGVLGRVEFIYFQF